MLSRKSTPSTQSKAKMKSTLRDYLESIAFALILALLIRTFVVQAFKIPSGSMMPTLQIGDQILVNRLAYGLRLPIIGDYLIRFDAPRRGDVVVFVFPNDRSKDFIKRVVAVAGDMVEIRGTNVYLNGERIEDPHAYFDGGGAAHSQPPHRLDFGPVRVPEGHFFVMGDNRDHSYDSRFWGFVDSRDVLGKAFVIYWSWDATQSWIRWQRIAELIR